MIDMHCHAWEHWPYEPTVSDPSSHGTVEQLLDQMDRFGVERAAIVAAAIDQNPENNAYVAAAVARHPDRLDHIADIDCVWSSDYHRPGASDRLEALVGRFDPVGVTHYVQPDNDGWLASVDGDDFVATAARLGVLISIACTPNWQEDLRAVATRHPSALFLCHHLAGLRVTSSEEEVAAVLASAACPNIMIKVSGFHYASELGWDFPYTHSQSIAARLIDAFGPARCMWGSDFPASKHQLTFRQSIEMVHSQLDLDERIRSTIMSETARDVLDRTRAR